MASILFDEPRGDRWYWVVQILEDETDTPVLGLEDYTGLSSLKRYADSTLIKSTTLVTVIDAAEAYVAIEWIAADTATISPGIFWCDIQFTLGTDIRTAGPFAVQVRGDISN